MAVRVLNFAAYVCLFALITQDPCSTALNSTPHVGRHYSKAITDLKEAIVKGLGFQLDDFKIFGFDMRDALVGRSVAYEFDLEIDNKVLPLKLLEDVNKWEHVDLPIFGMEDPVRKSDENGLVEKKPGLENGLPVLAPFQLAGPMELWMHDAKDIRLSLPHDVDAGELKKVMLADGAVVTVKGAKSVSLRHPVELPLPFNKTKNVFVSGLLTLAHQLRRTAQTQTQLVSLRIVGPTSLASPATSPPASTKLKLKRLAPGLVELSSVSKPKNALSTIEDARSLLTPDRLAAFWPVVSINGSNAVLGGFEALLASVLGSTASKNGSFRVLKADVSAQTSLKIGFWVEKKLAGNETFLEGYPEWRTKPEVVRMHYEVLAKVAGEKILPERVVEVGPVAVEDTVAEGVVGGNITMSKMPIVHVPPTPFAL